MTIKLLLIFLARNGTFKTWDIMNEIIEKKNEQYNDYFINIGPNLTSNVQSCNDLFRLNIALQFL